MRQKTEKPQNSSQQVIGTGSATGGKVEREYIHEEEGSVAGGQMNPDAPGLTREDKERIEKRLKAAIRSNESEAQEAGTAATGTLSDIATRGGGGEALGVNLTQPSPASAPASEVKAVEEANKKDKA